VKRKKIFVEKELKAIFLVFVCGGENERKKYFMLLGKRRKITPIFFSYFPCWQMYGEKKSELLTRVTNFIS
jgi:hypothetical protein